jgi:hypothetical protein
MADLTFLRYVVEDDATYLEFLWPEPGAGKATNYTIRLTDAELAAVTNAAQLRTLVTGKLQRKLQATGIASRLDSFIGQTVTI